MQIHIYVTGKQTFIKYNWTKDHSFKYLWNWKTLAAFTYYGITTALLISQQIPTTAPPLQTSRMEPCPTLIHQEITTISLLQQTIITRSEKPRRKPWCSFSRSLPSQLGEGKIYVYIHIHAHTLPISLLKRQTIMRNMSCKAGKLPLIILKKGSLGQAWNTKPSCMLHNSKNRQRRRKA